MLVTWVSRKGGRRANEDSVGKLRAGSIMCIAVADGLGGHTGGGLASETAVAAALDEFGGNPEFSIDAIKRYISAANNAVMDRAAADPDNIHMSSTIVLLLVKGKKAIWANVGDSRLYMFRSGRIAEVTEDHSLAFIEFLDGKIEYDEIKNSPLQNKLTSALGMSAGEINISEIKNIDNNTCFLLCSDGWWEYVSDEDMEDTLNQSPTARQWLEKMLDIREKAAPENSDNYTAAAVMM